MTRGQLSTAGGLLLGWQFSALVLTQFGIIPLPIFVGLLLMVLSLYYVTPK